MTNEELAKLLAKVKYTAEHGVFDAAEKSMLADMEVVGTALQSLIATAREAEALRAENARLLASVKGWAADAARLNDNADYWRQECHRLRERVERIGRDKETLLTFARAIQTWRSDADSYDEECDHPQRDYCEDVELMEKAAGYALRRIAERAALAGEK